CRRRSWSATQRRSWATASGLALPMLSSLLPSARPICSATANGSKPGLGPSSCSSRLGATTALPFPGPELDAERSPPDAPWLPWPERGGGGGLRTDGSIGSTMSPQNTRESLIKYHIHPGSESLALTGQPCADGLAGLNF